MNSSMLAGERRWASARRGGMTVLGKVAVPKPLNLPSQRLENHGLDPNVEIVPKGTLGWGSRPSSSGSNPWVSSSLSPNAEGGSISPSHIGGRPSSGGSGTRPSTAGSERTHEPVSGGAWGSNSRPASASGTLSSNQTSSASLRPSSAENRPNSSQSQLSRFADPVSKSSAAWSTNVIGDRLGAKSSKEDGFSLTSGDFPTLGTEKDNSMKISEFEDHGRPSSASGRIAHEKDDRRDQADAKDGTVNTWRADGPQGPDDDTFSSMEKWHGDNPQYFNPNAPPQHFDAWHGPPMRGPSGVWYRGQPRGPPFGTPVGRGGYPMEPLSYYRPQISPPPLVGPPPGTRGSHPKNGDLYRPQMPDASYGRPAMSFQPGFYSGPGPMAFESFYGPPMGYERDIAYMGMAAPPPVYNKNYPGPAPDMGNSHSRDGRGHHAVKASLEQGEAKDTQGPKRIALKSRNQCDQLEEGETRDHNLQQPDVSYPEKNCLPIIFSRKKEWGAEEDPEEAVHAKMRTQNEKSSRGYEYRENSMDSVNVKSFEGMGNAKAVNDNWTNLAENVTSLPLEMPTVPLCSVRDSSLPDVMKKSSLMHKIDGLNAKIRISDGRNDSLGASNREEARIRSQITDTKINNRTGAVSNTVGSFERSPASREFVSAPHQISDSVSDKSMQPMIVMSRQPHHSGQVRVDHRGKGKLNSQDADAWRKKPISTESSSVIMASHNESPAGSHAHGPNNVDEASESSVSNLVAKVDGDSVETHDSIDIQAQRAKLRGIAKQRALQLQKEEEERTKEQRAKALAKLEELNRRTLSGETGTEKTDKSRVINDIKGEQDDACMIDGPLMANHSNTNQAGEAVQEMERNLPVESDVTTNFPVQEDVHEVSVRKAAPQYNDPRHKRAGYKQKQNSSLQKSSTEKHVQSVAANDDISSGEHYPSGETKPIESGSKQKQNSALQKSFTEKYIPNVAANNDITSGEHCPSSETKLSESNISNTSDAVVERPVSQRRKSNRSAKNKHKPDETPLPPVESSINPANEFIENAQAKDSSSVSEVIEPEPNKAVKAQEVLCSSLPNEDSHSGKGSSQWRSHPSRRQPRSQQVNNKPNVSGDTAVWAPVNKAKVSVETSPDAVPESTNLTKGNNNSLKGKRAEMERYVPKPVAKELAQQVYAPNVSVTSSRLNDGSIKEANEVDIISHNKHSRKDQAAWKQRGPPDPSHMKGPNVESQSVKGDFDSVNAEIRTSVKDQGAKDKGKRNATKGSASTGNNNNKMDHEKSFRSEADANQVDRSIGSKENTSHWQPKSSGSNTAITQHGNRTESLAMEGSRFPKKEHKAQGGNYNQIQSGQSVNVNYNVAQEIEKERRQPYSPNIDPVGPGELPHEDVHMDRNIPLGSRRNNRQNNRPVRGHDSRGDWNSGHDNRPLIAPPFRDNRQSQNPHYEYQHAGPFKGNRPGRVEEPNGANSTGQRHRERGPRRGGGNFNRRQSGAAPASVDSGWE